MIRCLTIDDYEEVTKLVYQVHELHLENRPDIYNDGNPCPIGYYERIIKDKDAFKFGYIIENKIVGVIIGTQQITNSIPILKPRKIYFIDDIVVDKKFRRKGIANKLYNYILEKAKENNIDSIELVVWNFNNTAKSFYKSLGMKEKHIRYEAKIKK